VAVIALVMLLLSPSPRPGGRDQLEGACSGIHRGFTAVSFAGSGTRRFVPNWSGTGWGTFTLDDLSAGNHQVALDINAEAAHASA
jgi:hypothetical protein